MKMKVYRPYNYDDVARKSLISYYGRKKSPVNKDSIMVLAVYNNYNDIQYIIYSVVDDSFIYDGTYIYYLDERDNTYNTRKLESLKNHATNNHLIDNNYQQLLNDFTIRGLR